MKHLSILFCIATLILSSCQPENRVYEKHQSLSPDVEWLQDDHKTFEVKIEDSASTYAFNIAFRYAQGFPWNAAKILVKETSPSGLMTETPYTLKVRDDEGNYLGEPGYDIWDSTHLVDAQKSYKESGIYTYVISHKMPKSEFPFAMEVGLIIDKNSPV